MCRLERRGGRLKVCSPGRRFDQMNISHWSLFSSGHPLFTCWLCGCVLRLQTCVFASTAAEAYPLSADYCPALPTPSKGDICATKGAAAFWKENLILEGEEFRPQDARCSSDTHLYSCRKRRMHLLCLLFGSFFFCGKNNIWTICDLFLLIIIPPREVTCKASCLAALQILNQLFHQATHLLFSWIFLLIL